MKPFAKVFASMFDRQPHDENKAARRAFHLTFRTSR